MFQKFKMKTLFVVAFVIVSFFVLVSKSMICNTIFKTRIDKSDQLSESRLKSSIPYCDSKAKLVHLFSFKTFQLTKSLCAQFNEQTVYCKSQSQNDLKHCGVLISLCTSARVPPFHKCPPGYVGVGFCLPPFEKCDVGFCYIEDAFSLQMGQSGVCCLRRKWSEKNIAIKCFSHIIICSF